MLLKSKIKPLLSAVVVANLLTACAGMTVPLKNQADLLQGPPVTDIFTHFDLALMCLKGQLRSDIAFSVGAILDQTGKDAITNGGSGKFITQGAGDMVQSALFQAGVTVLNRRDPRIIESEAKLGIRNPKHIKPSDYFITGSINSLDFIPGGGFDMQVSGVGPAYSQTRIIVGLDVSLTDAKTSQVVANTSLQKQIVAQDYSLNSGRFVGRTLLNVQIGAGEREATNFALRQMLNLATFELLSQVIPPSSFAECRAKIPAEYGHLKLSRSAVSLYKYEQEMAKKKVEKNQQSTDVKHLIHIEKPTKAISENLVNQSNVPTDDSPSVRSKNDVTPELINNAEVDSDAELKRKKDTIIKYSDQPIKDIKPDSKTVSLKRDAKTVDKKQDKRVEDDQLVLSDKSLVRPSTVSPKINTKSKTENTQPSHVIVKKVDHEDATKSGKKHVEQQQEKQVASDHLQGSKLENPKELPLVFIDKATGDFKFIMNIDELNGSSDANVIEEKENATDIGAKKQDVLSSRKTVNSKNKDQKIEKAKTQDKTLLDATDNQHTNIAQPKSDAKNDSDSQELSVLTEENAQVAEAFWGVVAYSDEINDPRNNVALH